MRMSCRTLYTAPKNAKGRGILVAKTYDTESNVSTYQDFFTFFLSVENSLHSALLLPKAYTKLSMLFLLRRSNLGTSKHGNKYKSKLKQAKSNLANLKQTN